MLDIDRRLVAYLTIHRAARVTDLVALGISRSAIHTRIGGLLVSLGPGIVGLRDDPDPRRRRLAAALAAHCDAVLSHATAAELHGLPFRGDGTVHLLDEHGRRARVDATLHRVSSLRPADIEMIDGLRCTSVPRTLCDLAAVAASDRHYEWLVKETVAILGVDRDGLLACADALSGPGRPGARRRRAVFGRVFGDGPYVGVSVLERRFELLVRKAGIDGVVFGFEPPWFDGRSGVVDAAIPHARLIIELDGRRWHVREDRFADDRRRDRQAVAAGWRVLRFTWDEVVGDPDVVIRSITRTIAA